MPYISWMFMGPKGSTDHGLRRSAIEILIVDVDLLADMSPLVMLRVCVVRGVWMAQLRLVESVPCRPVQMSEDVASLPVVPYHGGISMST